MHTRTVCEDGAAIGLQMSAIFGILGDCSKSELAQMAGRMSHRGMHSNTWSPSPGVHFGEVRHWPRERTEPDCVVGSAQLNLDWRKIATEEFSSPHARDRAQRAALYNAISAYGEDAGTKLDGGFSFAYWDTDRHELGLCVDRYNYSSLYFFEGKGRVAFASEYKALLALEDLQPAPNRRAMQYLASVISFNLEAVLMEDVRRVPRGCVVHVGRGGVRVTRYWTPVQRRERQSLQEFSRRLQVVLGDYISATCHPYTRLAVTLSGGLDSTGLVALIRRHAPHIELATYTIGHSETDQEAINARQTAEYFATEHHEFTFAAERIQEQLPKLIWLAEEFGAREESLLQYQIEGRLLGREEAVLAGHGADVAFGGMPRHRLLRMSDALPIGRTAIKEVFQQTQSGKVPETVLGKIGSWILYKGHNQLPPTFIGETEVSTVPMPRTLDDYITADLGGMQSLSYISALQQQFVVDALFPFLSNRIFDLALAVPGHLKTGFFSGKIVLAHAMSSVLPESIRNRKKAIQRSKRDAEFFDIVGAMAKSLELPRSLNDRGLVNREYTEKVIRRGKNGLFSNEQFSRIWALIIIEIWCRTFLDDRGQGPINLAG